MTNIPLHPEKGINPFLTFCPRCAGETNEIAFVGSNDGVYECSFCHVMQVGKDRGGKCGACGHAALGARVRSLKDGERIPGGLCNKCAEQSKMFAEVVAAGGVYWRCSTCRREGVMKANAYTEQIRKDTKVLPPKPLAVNFTGDNCPVCSKDIPKETMKDADQVGRGGGDGAAPLPSRVDLAPGGPDQGEAGSVPESL